MQGYRYPQSNHIGAESGIDHNDALRALLRPLKIGLSHASVKGHRFRLEAVGLFAAFTAPRSTRCGINVEQQR
ncbi:MAG: hypothetical protein ACK5VP_09810, partial [Betaproteobacteria bacterium]